MALLKSLYSLICCVYHLKTRDLRTKVYRIREQGLVVRKTDSTLIQSFIVPHNPHFFFKVALNRDYLKVINTDVPLDGKGKPIRHQRVTTTVQNNDGSTDSFHIRGSDSDRVTSTIPNESLPNVSRPSAIECGSNLEKQCTGFPAKRYEL